MSLAEISWRAEKRILAAMHGWSRGFPMEEVALMNRLTAQLLRPGYCGPRIGAWNRWLIPMHRQGPGGTDLFGSDFAVTVYIPALRRLKTALIQLKTTSNRSCSLERTQLLRAKGVRAIEERSFVAAAHKTALELRVESFAAILGRSSVENITDRLEHWLPSHYWIYRWLSCNIGPASGLGRAATFEHLLARRAMTGAADFPFLAERLSTVPSELDLDLTADSAPILDALDLTCWLVLTVDARSDFIEGAA